MLRLGIGLVGLLLSCGCVAGQWYAELGFLRSEGSLPDDADRSFIGFDTENRDSGWKLNGGYELNRYFALEFGYADYGKQQLQSHFLGPVLTAAPVFNPDSTWFNPFTLASQPVFGASSGAFAVADPGLIPPGTELETSLQAIPLSAIGQLPVNDWFSLTLHGGALLSRYETVSETRVVRLVNGEMVPVTLRDSETSSDAELFVGLGFLFSVSEQFGLELSWEKILDAGDEDTFEQDIDAYNLGLRYHF